MYLGGFEPTISIILSIRLTVLLHRGMYYTRTLQTMSFDPLDLLSTSKYLELFITFLLR